jgi:methyltransferase (TIGR00027 family)
MNQKVSATALGTCIMRATSYYESELAYKSQDYIAPMLIPTFLTLVAQYNALRRILKKVVFKVPGIYEYVIARTNFIDEIFKDSVGSVEQVLIFGAGFDSRAIRFSQQLKSAKVFELDAPKTQAAKINRLKEKNSDFPSNLNFVAIDFNSESLEEKLKQAGFQKDRVCLFLLEGLTYYLEDEAVDSTLRLISDCSRPGSLLVFDYANAEAAQQEMVSDQRKVQEVHQALIKAGEKPGFVLAENVHEFLAKYNFAVAQELTSAALANRYFAQADLPLGAQKFRIVKAIKM